LLIPNACKELMIFLTVLNGVLAEIQTAMLEYNAEPTQTRLGFYPALVFFRQTRKTLLRIKLETEK
jgi:hypothetical protein